MRPRGLDVLEDRGHPGRLAVGEHVDVELVRALEELVDEARPVDDELLRPARDAHPAAAEDVVRTDEHRVADLRGDLARLLGALRDAPGGRPEAEPRQQLAEGAAVLRRLDGRERVAEERDAGVCEGARQAQRRLAAQGDDDAERLLERADVEDALERHGLEVEPVARVVVGRDRLGVRVDHHGLVAELAKRAGRAHAAVVELDPLADPVRPGADDDDGAAGRAPRRVARPRTRGSSRASAPRTRRRRSRPRAGRGGLARPGSRSPATPERLGDQRVRKPEALRRRHIAVGRAPARPRQRISAARASKYGWRPGDLGQLASPSSRPSSAFRNASGNVRPSPSASPIARISVPSVGSAPGNLSKSKRGALTAT